jgi:hypothetical protein
MRYRVLLGLLLITSAAYAAPATQNLLGNNNVFTGTNTFTQPIVGVVANLSGTNSGDVTLGTANGLSLAGQVLSLQAATNSVPGALTAADYTSFAAKQPALGFTPLDIAGSNSMLSTLQMSGNAIAGDSISGGNLTLQPTSNATKGAIIAAGLILDGAGFANTLNVGKTTTGVTDLTINPATKTSGNLVNLAVNGASKFKVDFSGVSTSTSILVGPASAGLTTTGSADILIKDGAGNTSFRGTRANAWSDTTNAGVFQVGNTTDCVIVSAASGTALRRFSITSAVFQVSAATYLNVPVPILGDIFEIISGAAAARLIVKDTGLVGIGTTSPGSNNKLEVKDGIIAMTQTTAPTATSCGSSQVFSAGATDESGTITITGVATVGCVLNFNITHAKAPICVINLDSTLVFGYMASSNTTTATFTMASSTNPVLNYVCR